MGERSRTVGQLMAEEYQKKFKTALQEGLELMGYVLMAWGSARFGLFKR